MVSAAQCGWAAEINFTGLGLAAPLSWHFCLGISWRYGDNVGPMASPPTIAHVIVGLTADGAQRSLQQLITHSCHQFDHRVYCLGPPTPLSQSLSDAGIAVHCFPISRLNPISWLLTLWRLRQVLAAEHAQLIQGWMYLGNVVASLLSKFSGHTGHLCWNVRSDVTDLGAESWTTRWALRIASWDSMQPDLVIYNSHAAQSSHAQFGFAQIPDRVIVNGVESTPAVEPEDVMALRDQFNLGQDPVIGMVARFHPVKGVEVFLQAAAGLVTADKKLQILLVGSGMQADNPQLMQIVADCKVPSANLHLLGQQDNAAAIMRCMDVLVVASHREGTPNVLLEAMASGVACVSTAVGDAPRLLRDPLRIAPVGDAARLGQSIQAALSSGQQWRQADQHYVAQHHSIKVCTEQYASTYKELLG